MGAASLPYVCGANIMLLLNQFVVVLGTPHVNQPFVHMMCTFFTHLLTTDNILLNPLKTTPEMKRLMRAYGSLKCLRNRTPKDPDKAAKVESVKRKFYRWFPDLDQRFERTEEEE